MINTMLGEAERGMCIATIRGIRRGWWRRRRKRLRVFCIIRRRGSRVYPIPGVKCAGCLGCVNGVN